jgi:hypothetical protein
MTLISPDLMLEDVERDNSPPAPEKLAPVAITTAAPMSPSPPRKDTMPAVPLADAPEIICTSPDSLALEAPLDSFTVPLESCAPPLEMLTVPDSDDVESPDAIDKLPVDGVLELSPVAICTVPEAVPDVVAPLLSVSEPAPVEPLPAVMFTDPPIPEVETPTAISMEPEALEVDAPVDSSKEPDV